jgi:hypothetical protein
MNTNLVLIGRTLFWLHSARWDFNRLNTGVYLTLPLLLNGTFVERVEEDGHYQIE